MHRPSTHLLRVALYRNQLRRARIEAMPIPYGSHCKAWATVQLDEQLQTLLSLLKGEIHA